MRFIKGLLLFLLVIVVIVAVVIGGGYLYLTRRALPQTDGTVQLPGLRAPVTIIRDKNGVPHIYAGSPHDLFFAQGYVQAQDRLWQMESFRAGIAGTTSQLQPSIGNLEADKFVRTLGWRRAAEADYEAAGPEAREILQAFADGVNAYRNAQNSNVPSEFFIVGAFGSKGPGFLPQPWDAIDSLQTAKYMAWDLSGNASNEMFHVKLMQKFGAANYPAVVNALQPPYDDQSMPIIVPEGIVWQNVPDRLAVFDGLDAVFGKRGRGLGSNNWVVSGSRSTTGQPILANDPHLSFQIPALWYFNSVHCQPVSAECPYDVIGASLPGVPGIVIGHNARIAWGVTNVGPDVQDLFIEKVDNTTNQYEYKGQQLDLKIVSSSWTIKGKLPEGYQPSSNEVDEYDPSTDTTKITLNVRYTGHGPLITDVDAAYAVDNQPVAFSWTAINVPDKALESFFGINVAQNWEDFRAALSLFGTPSQNFIYADVDGNIGYQTPGRIPIRAKGDGQLPVPGWTGEYDWTGYIPFDELPRAYNPAKGYIATANNAVVGPDFPYFLSMEWDRGYRAKRIVDMIEAKDKLSADDMAAIQGDDLDIAAQQIAPFLNGLQVQGDAQKVLNAIQQWDFYTSEQSVGASAYQVFWLHLLRNTFDDDLGDLAQDYVSGDDVNRQAMILLLAQPAAKWWDDAATSDRAETRDDILKQSLADAAQDLVAQYGSDPNGWQWGKLHTVTFEHRALGDQPVAFIYNRGPFPVSAYSALVNNTAGSFGFSYQPGNPKLTDIMKETWGPSLRQIVDLSNLNDSRFIHTTGQSGLPTSSHYDDMTPLWLKIQYVPMWWNATDVKANAEGTLTLTP
ncbi:MAG: penicillin acylase family protein [Chloroflexi bacterium]|nr:penicillin acylase family protein [Chloroflexota bacterium]